MASFGEDLKRERELRDISIEEISQATNISKTFLEALEQNRFDSLPGGAYTRGFIRSYALHVGIDVEETLDAFRAEIERREVDTGGAARPPAQRSMAPQPGRAPEAVVGSGLVLATLLVGLLYWSGGTAEGVAIAQPDPEAHGAALRARFKKTGALPSIPGLADPSEAPSSVQEDVVPAVEDPNIAQEVMVRLRARETTSVELSCGGRVQFAGEMWVGAERHFPCRGAIVIGADNAGAIDYSVGAGELRPLGAPGERIRETEITPEPPAAAPTDAPPQGH